MRFHPKLIGAEPLANNVYVIHTSERLVGRFSKHPASERSLDPVTFYMVHDKETKTWRVQPTVSDMSLNAAVGLYVGDIDIMVRDGMEERPFRTLGWEYANRFITLASARYRTHKIQKVLL